MANASRHLGYVDALRGIAILIVVLLHASQAIPSHHPTLAWWLARGELGVQLFYIMSAITLCMSWDARSKQETSPVRNFLLRRFFRIAPMFYAAIVFYLCVLGFEPRYWAPDGIDWNTVLLTIVFLHGFHPETINSVVPGGWSITVEMTFYVLLPLLLTKLPTLRSRLVFLLLSLAVYYLWRKGWTQFYGPQYPPEQQYLVNGSVYYSFFSQLPIFVTGLIAYLLLRDRNLHERTVRIGAVLLPAAALVGWAVLPGDLMARIAANHFVAGAVFALIALTLARYPLPIICNRPIIFIGKVSYSMYLTHFAVFHFLAWSGLLQLFPSSDLGGALLFVCVVPLSAAVAYPCYKFIEKPGIALGQRVIERLSVSQPTLAGSVASPVLSPSHIDNDIRR